LSAAVPPGKQGDPVIRDLTDDCAVLQSGYWRVQVDTARPHVVSLRADPLGRGSYCQEILEPGWGADSSLETEAGRQSSRASRTHSVEAQDDGRLCLRNIRIGDAAQLNWTLELAGPDMNVLRIAVQREMLRELQAVTDLVFGCHALREFAFWSRPSLRFNHATPRDRRPGYCPYEERRKRRVIGYHARDQQERFIIHGSPSFPDLVQRISSGFHHLEQHYTQHVSFGLSSADFTSGPQRLPQGTRTWAIEFSLSPQGALAPVTFSSGHAPTDAFVPAFFDSFLLSSVACDHEYFGNNPYRHAYAPGALDHLARGFLVTDRRAWSAEQGDIEERWRNHLRRTLAEGARPDGRLMILLDSGVWQDQCGTATGKDRPWFLEMQFITACALHLLKTGDLAFAGELYPRLKRLLDEAGQLDSDGDGLLENPIPGTPGSPASCYNDNLCIGHKDGCLNSAAHEALRRVASLAEWLGQARDAVDFRERARRLAVAFNAQLWNDGRNCYYGWIDRDGGKHDAWYTLVNFPAVTSGLVPAERLPKLMASFLAHPNHHRIFAGGVNLDPIPACDIACHCGPFGIWLNGGILLGPAAHELYARAAAGGGECAWAMLADVLGQWERDHLCGTPLYDWIRPVCKGHKPAGLLYTGKNAYTWIRGDGATRAGTEPYLADGGAMLWALYEGVCGIRADFQKLRIEPHLPKAFRSLRLTLRLMGKRLEFRYQGTGDRLGNIRVNGQASRQGNDLPWSVVPDESRIEIAMEG
jgi:hypothetical protein